MGHSFEGFFLGFFLGACLWRFYVFLFSFDLDGGGKVGDVVVVTFVPLGEAFEVGDEGVVGRDIF